MAKRYGQRPSSIAKSSPEDLELDLLVLSEAIKEEVKQSKKQAAKAGSGHGKRMIHGR